MRPIPISLSTRKKKHMRSVKNCKTGSNIAKHAWSIDHAIDFNSTKVIDRANFRHRGTLESLHTAILTNADNNAKHLPERYSVGNGPVTLNYSLCTRNPVLYVLKMSNTTPFFSRLASQRVCFLHRPTIIITIIIRIN